MWNHQNCCLYLLYWLVYKHHSTNSFVLLVVAVECVDDVDDDAVVPGSVQVAVPSPGNDNLSENQKQIHSLTQAGRSTPRNSTRKSLSMGPWVAAVFLDSQAVPISQQQSTKHCLLNISTLNPKQVDVLVWRSALQLMQLILHLEYQLVDIGRIFPTGNGWNAPRNNIAMSLRTVSGYQ